MGLEEEIRQDGCAWVSVNGFAICIETTDHGISVEIHDEAKLDDGALNDALLAKVGAHFSELRGEADGTL